MKKIVSSALIVGSQLMIVGLFLMMLFYPEKDDNKVVVVENSNLTKMADSVSELFLSEVTPIEESKTDVEEKLLSEEEATKAKEAAKAAEEAKKAKEEVKAPVVSSSVDTSDYPVLNSYTGTLTGYGPNCAGCSGYTASGYNVSQNTFYSDSTYGDIRIVAADPSIPLYSVVRINNAPVVGTVVAIVLDRGGNVGFGRGTLFDLLFASETEVIPTSSDITFDILRLGK